MSPYTLGEHTEKEEAVDTHDTTSVHKVLREIVLKVIKWDESGVQNDDNLLVLGMNSLQALQFIRHLRKTFNKPNLPITTLYTNPSLNQLKEAIIEISKKNNQVQRSLMKHITVIRLRKPLSIVTYQLVGKVFTKDEPATDSFLVNEHVFILTGSTGFLGSYILHNLLQNASVSHIYCLDRTSDAHLRHLKKNQDFSKPIDFPVSKVTILKAGLSKPGLGLHNEIYKQIQDSATDFIHSAWPHNQYSLIYPVIPTTRISLIHFLHHFNSGSRLEKIIDGTSAPLPMGYAESKFITENILNYASKQDKLKNIDIKVARVGQIAGPAYTFWYMEAI